MNSADTQKDFVQTINDISIKLDANSTFIHFLAIETGLNELRALSQYLKEHAAQLKRLEETLEEKDI